jgi:hypothetical protein
MTTIERLAPTTTGPEVARCLDELGYAVIERLQPPALMDRLLADIAPHADRTPVCRQEFFGGALKMFTGIIAKSPAYVELLDTPLVSAVAEAVLGDDPLLNATAMYILETGGRGQTLHQDESTYSPAVRRRPGDPHIMTNSMWAATDFTAENGATRLIPGSHRWPPDRVPGPDDTVIQLTMERGSYAVWLGSTWHGGGINRTAQPRIGAEMGFNPGWLRPYEAELLVVPPMLARELPDRVRSLLGYTAYRGILGTVDRQHPSEALGWQPTSGLRPEDIPGNLAPSEVEAAIRAFIGRSGPALSPEASLAFDRLCRINREIAAEHQQAVREVLEVTSLARSRDLLALLHRDQLLDGVLAAAGR